MIQHKIGSLFCEKHRGWLTDNLFYLIGTFAALSMGSTRVLDARLPELEGLVFHDPAPVEGPPTGVVNAHFVPIIVGRNDG